MRTLSRDLTHQRGIIIADHHQQIGRLRPAVALSTISLQPSQSCASPTASLMPILVSWRMSSQTRVLGRPRPLGPKTMPVRSTLSRLSLRRMCPMNLSFLALMMSINRCSQVICWSTSSLVFFSVQLIRSRRR